MSAINIGLAGAGTIGGGVVKIIAKQGDFFRNKLNIPVYLKTVADKNTKIFETLPLDGVKTTDNAYDIIEDKDISIVIELIGGTTFARQFVIDALKNKKHVITANKALIAEYGPEIFKVAEENNVSVYFEAAVGGGMPSIKTIRESLIGNDILSVETIINGTCNYILTKMKEDNLSFDTALKLAQENGFAEADPTLDIGGGDTAHKVVIMASLLYGGYVPYDSINVEGITNITVEDIKYADSMGYEIKLLGIIKNRNNGIDIRVHPAMISKKHILASVKYEFNAVSITGDAVGPILIYGKGAGEMPTASAVISDVIDVARNIMHNAPKRISMEYYTENNKLNLMPMEEVTGRYYLRFTVIDKPGVFAGIASVLGEYNISIASVLQKEENNGEAVPVIIITHEAIEKDILAALSKVEQKEFIREKTHIIRIVD